MGQDGEPVVFRLTGRFERSNRTAAFIERSGPGTDVTLNNSFGADGVNVTDKFDLDFPAGFGDERQVFVPDVLILLQHLEGCFVRGDVLKSANLPEPQPEHVFKWILKQIEQKGIYV